MRQLTLAAALAACACAAAGAGAAVPKWSAPKPLTRASADSYAVGLSDRGEAVAAWTDSSGLYVAIAAPGHRFAAPQHLSSRATPPPGRLLAVDRRGDALVLWVEPSGGRAPGLYVSFRPVRGRFGAPQRIAGVPDAADFGLDAKGTATLVWQTRGRFGVVTLRAVERQVSGRLRHAQVIARGVSTQPPALAVDGRDDAVVVWQTGYLGKAQILAASRRAGGRFGRPVTVSPAGGATNAALGIDDAGHALIAWNGPYSSAATGFPYTNVQAAWLKVGARASGPVQQLASDPHAGGLTETGPTVLVDRHGDALAVWDAYSAQPSGSGSGSTPPAASLELARATRRGPLQLGTPYSTDAPDVLPGAALGARGQALIAWTNAVTPAEVLSAPSATSAFGSPQPYAVPGDLAAGPLAAVSPSGRAIILWRDLGPPGGSASTSPLLYTQASIR